MNPQQFEQLVCEHFRKKGYKAETTSYNNDYGVDVFATKGNEKIAIQAKMYGSTSRKINRQMIMELHGAKDYFDCTKAIMATNGIVLPDAQEVADKLKIEILNLGGNAFPLANSIKVKTKQQPAKALKKGSPCFESIWEQYIMPLQGKTISRSGGKSNTITKVDWSGIERLTSNNNKGKIKIEIFRFAINQLLTRGTITREEINQNYSGRASSGVVLVLSKVPMFRLEEYPIKLVYSPQSLSNPYKDVFNL